MADVDLLEEHTTSFSWRAGTIQSFYYPSAASYPQHLRQLLRFYGPSTQWCVAFVEVFTVGVLSRLTDLLAFEDGRTRLQVSYQPATDKDSGQHLGSWSCYVQVHERGKQAITAEALSDLLSDLPSPTGQES